MVVAELFLVDIIFSNSPPATELQLFDRNTMDACAVQVN